MYFNIFQAIHSSAWVNKVGNNPACLSIAPKPTSWDVFYCTCGVAYFALNFWHLVFERKPIYFKTQYGLVFMQAKFAYYDLFFGFSCLFLVCFLFHSIFLYNAFGHIFLSSCLFWLVFSGLFACFCKITWHHC